MRLILAALYIVFLLTSVVSAQTITLKPFIYTQDFEGQDPVSKEPWAVGAKYTLNFKGLTNEKAHSGKQSYKIDANFEEGSYLYFSIPVKIPVQGNLHFSAYIFVPDENQGQVATGVDYVFPPTPTSGCRPLNNETFTTTKGEWKLVQGDITAEGKSISNGLITKYMWGISNDEVADADKSPIGIYVDRIGFFLIGSRGKRVIMYLDDIKIEGETPDNAAYDALIQDRWASIKDKVTKKITQLDTDVTKIKNDLSAMTQLSGESAELKKDAEAYLLNVKTRLDDAKTKPYLEISDQTFIEEALRYLNNLRIAITDFNSGKIYFDSLRVSVVTPISDIKILPTDKVIQGKITDIITLSACPGEFVPCSFVVRPSVKLNALYAKASGLKNGANVIPASNIDVKLVKCWYQSGTAGVSLAQDKSRRILVPELLLNDDRLIKVDYVKQDNYIRGIFSEGEKYLWISDATLSTSMGYIKVSEYPVADAPTLMPMELDAKTNQQFWITIKVPDETKPGNYSGQITLYDGDKSLGSLKLQITVLPFTLDAPYYTSSVYYRGILDKGWEKGSISSEYKSEQQLKAEISDMLNHGVHNPTVYQSFDNKELLGRYLSISCEVGWKGTSIYFLGLGIGAFAFATPDGLEAYKKACAEAKTFFKQYDIKDVYMYGIDEATGEILASQRKGFAAAHEAGVKLFVAGYGGTFESVGDLLDILVYAGEPSLLEAGKWHSSKHAIWNYGNPQGGVENPLVYRRNFGLLLWKRNFDGACTYAYQHSFGNIWNDFDDGDYRDHNMAYPTVNGVIDTIEWEGYREGVTDVRYLTTLLNTIKMAKTSGKHKAVKAAETFLKSIDVQNGDLNAIRAEMVNHIMLLRK